MEPPTTRSQRLLWAIATFQAQRPVLMAVLVLLITVPSAIAASGLGLKTSFKELLPENKDSVVEMNRVSERLTSASTLTIVAEGDDTEALKEFVRRAGPRLRELGPEWVGAVDDGVHESQKFLSENKFLYAPYDDIKKLRDEVVERYDEEVANATGLGLVDDVEQKPLTADTVRERLKEAEVKAEEARDRYPGGFYLGEDGRLIAIMVRTPISGGDLNLAAGLQQRIDKIVADIDPASIDPSIRVSYTGDFITSTEEYQTVKDDLAHVGIWGVSMILAVVLVFFLRFRTLLAMGLTIGVGLAWTFGFTRFTIGYLNSSTGFLVSIVAGNGINVGIMYMARYLEARRSQHMEVIDAIRTAHRDTWLATLAASSAAMVAYGSLAATDFKGFKHFGVIGGAGMFLCWVATFATLPAILVLTERVSPMFVNPKALRSRLRGFYGLAFAWVARRIPRTVVAVSLLLGLLAALASVRYVVSDPMEYDLSNLSNDHKGKTPARKMSIRVDKVVGRMGQDGMAVMVERLDQVAPLKAALDRRLAEAPEDKKPFERVVTLYDLLPDRQPEKIKMVEEVVDRIQRARTRGFINDKDWTEIEPQLPSRKLAVLGIEDLPERMARAFTEMDGTRGRIVFIVPKKGRSIWDGRYLDLWAASFREVKLPNGEVIKGSGRAVIYSDMLRAVREDAPKAILISLLGTLFVVAVAFRFRRDSLLVLGTVLLGVAWLVAFIYLRDIKLNFLNFVALPITFGVGADYAVNMMRRFRLENYENLHQVIVETGGAVVLCSLTTTLGYTALLFSMNRAIRSFGTVAAVGEITTLVAAALVLPSLLYWRKNRKAAQDVSDAPSA
jgi:uncharacterized protein